MDSPVIVDQPTQIQIIPNTDKLNGGFFGRSESPEADDFGDPWLDIAARHPELANIRHSPWSTWGARKRRGSATGQERPAADFPQERGRIFRDSVFDDFLPEFRENLPDRWNQRFEPENHENYSQTLPRQNHQHFVDTTPDHLSHVFSDKSTQTPVDECKEKSFQAPNLTQHGLRNTVDLGQKTAAESDRLDAEASRNLRSMSAPPDDRFPSMHRQNQMGNGNPSAPQPQHQAPDHNPGNKQPAVHVIPIFVEGRDEPVINDKPDIAANFAEPRQFKNDFFSNQNVPHGFQHSTHTPMTRINKGLGGRQSSPSGFGLGRTTHQQPAKQEQANQTGAFKAGPHNVHINNEDDLQKPSFVNEQFTASQPVPQQQAQPKTPAQQQPQARPMANDPISKIQSIQKDVLDLMTQLENFKGKRGDKEYNYLDEMLTRNMLKLDVIDTEGKENIRSARKEAIKCIEKCIAVLEAKGESGFNAENNKETEDQAALSTDNLKKSNSINDKSEKMETTAENSTENEKLEGNETCDKNNENKLGASDKVENVGGQMDGADDMQVDEKNDSNPKDSNNTNMDLDTSSQ